MTKIPYPLTLLSAMLACALYAAPAQAQRVFVSATGSDGNPCSFTLPCRSFQHAHDVAAANGEIDVLDPAGYGSIIITKAISIQGHGYSGISVASGATGITINASASDKVNLNGLLIDGAGVGQNGIVFNSGQSLALENCVVRNMTLIGLEFLPTAAAAPTLAVSNSYFNDNGNAAIHILTKSSGAVTAAIDRTEFHNNLLGLNVNGANGTGALTVAVTDSVAANNGSGFFVFSIASHSVTNLSLIRTAVVGSANTGVKADATGTLWLAQSTITGSTLKGFETNSGGVIMTYGDNFLNANGSNVGSLTPANTQ
jgi:hypothetical protein